MTLAASPDGLPITSAAMEIASDGIPLSGITVNRLPGIAFAGIASFGAGAVHAAAAGIHAEHPQLARLFVGIAALQLAVGLFALLRPSRPGAWLVIGINAAAVGGWAVTRVTGVSWIDGLEVRESPQFADTACALLAAAAVGTALAAAMIGWRKAHPVRLALPSLAIAALAVPAMMLSGTHSHSSAAGHGDHGSTAAAPADDHAHDSDTHTVATGDTVPHSHDTVPTDTASAPWPRPWDPTQPIDLSGVSGVSAEQEARAVALVEDTLRDLPRYADPAAAVADGYLSIGDGVTGTEHFLKASIVNDDVFLDSKAPESLVYQIEKDGSKTLTGAMYLSDARPADDLKLTDFAGPLMTWHLHNNLCWAPDAQGVRKIVALTDANGVCPRGEKGSGTNPMVHVWITPHDCGVFAALEGVGAGTAAVSEEERVDKCHEHHDMGPVVEPKAYDPALPIDLSGTPGVTPAQQAEAENLIAVTVVRLPQWSDYKVAEAAGFRSIGDGATGHEHFIQWDWINDDTILDPDYPESLVYEPQPDGSKKLVSAMYMLRDEVSLDEVPAMGGALMQWHIHDNLCFTNDPNQPRVAGITSSTGTCPAGLTKFNPAAMIHVWITPHPCGPFAALEGVGAGQIKPGETRLCDTAHGAHTP